MQSQAISVRETDRHIDFQAASQLYRHTFAYADENLKLNSHLLKAIVVNGGVAVGAFRDDGDMVGFSYGFPGHEPGTPYLYSQATVVAPEAQGLGLGRRLKQRQRLTAQERGYAEIRWVFDPVLARNAHFNLSTLGARGTQLVREFYDTADSHRMIVRWPVDTDEPPPIDVPDHVAAELRTAPAGTIRTDAATPADDAPAGTPADDASASATPGPASADGPSGTPFDDGPINAERHPADGAPAGARSAGTPVPLAYVAVPSIPAPRPRIDADREAVCVALANLLTAGYQATACVDLGEGVAAYVLTSKETR